MTMNTSKLDVSGERAKRIEELCSRLRAVFSDYNCEPTPDGWRSLALSLLAKYELGEPQVKTESYPRLFALLQMHALLRDKPYLKFVEAARRVAREVYRTKSTVATAKRAETLRKQYREAVRDGTLTIIPADVVKFWTALWDAAAEIEKNRKITNLSYSDLLT